MKIELGKTYRTKRGDKVRILCIDREDTRFPIVGLVNNRTVETYTLTGDYSFHVGAKDLDGLIDEVSEWDDVAIDTRVIVIDNSGMKLQRYFAGMRDGRPTSFAYGATSWSNVTNRLVPQVLNGMCLADPE